MKVIQMKIQKKKTMMSENQVKKKALNLLSRRDHYKKELKYKLIKRGFSAEKIEDILQELINDGYLNDKKFAEEWIKNRINKKPRGKNLIKAELLEKGVDKKIIETKLNNLLDPDKEKQMAEILTDKWLNKRNCKNKETKEKLYRYLKNKGFNDEIIRKIITDINL